MNKTLLCMMFLPGILMAQDADLIITNARVATVDKNFTIAEAMAIKDCLLYTSPSPRDGLLSRMPSSA